MSTRPVGKKAAPKKAAPKKAAAPNLVWNQYEDLLRDLNRRMTGEFLTGVRQAIKAQDAMAARIYLAWRLANHSSIRNRAMAPLRERYSVPDSRRFVMLIFQGAKTLDDQYLMRQRKMLQNMCELLDNLVSSGEWRLPALPTLQVIEAKITELGGIEDPIPNIHRIWVNQQSEGVRRAAAARDEEDRKRYGFDTVEELHTFREQQEETARVDSARQAWRRFHQSSLEKGERIDPWGAGDGIIVAHAGIAIRMTDQEEVQAIVTMINMRRRNQADARKSARRTQHQTWRQGATT